MPDQRDSAQKSTEDYKFQNVLKKQGYNIGTYEFPEGLRVDPDKQHYVVFKILVREKTAQKNGTLGQTLPKNPVRDSARPEFGRITENTTLRAQENIGEAGAVLGGLSVAAYEGAKIFKQSKGGTLTTLFKNAVNVRQAAKSGIRIAAGTAAGYLAGELVENFTKEFNYTSTLRLKDVITLHIEESPTAKFGINYNTKDLGTIAGAVIQSASAESAGDAASTLGTAFGRTVATLATLPASLGSTSIGDVFSFITKTRTNPFREVMFESTDYREFTFRYRFFPKNDTEVTSVYNILQQFKFHMHPSISENRIFFVYPSEFEIEYYYKNQPNDKLPKIARCALTDMQVDYGGSQFATFADGAPVEIGLTLKFIELEQMTQEGIQKNGY